MKNKNKKTITDKLPEIVSAYRSGVSMRQIARLQGVSERAIWASIQRHFNENFRIELSRGHFCNKEKNFIVAMRMGYTAKALANKFGLTLGGVYAKVKRLIKNGCLTEEDTKFWGTRLSVTARKLYRLLKEEKLFDVIVLAKRLKISPSFVYVRAQSLLKYGLITEDEYRKLLN